MGLRQPIKSHTPQEYYRLEREAEYRSDYYKGEIFAMAGGTERHSRIVSNILGELHGQLKGKPCAEYESNLRLKVSATGLRCYPDVNIYCSAIEYDAEDDQRDTAINPTVLFEVLSESTERYDRGFKSSNYRQIPSLKAYVLVLQDRPHLEVYRRQANDTWLLSEETRLEGSVDLPGTGVILPLAEVYARIKFQSPLPTPQPPIEKG